MFAFAIWDGRRRELFLARDRIGVKPLYYAELPGGFVFGSEIKALLEHPAVTPDIDEHAFFDYLTFAFTPPPRTMYRGISKVAPAERMVVRADGTVVRDRYWDPLAAAAESPTRDMSEREMTERVRELLQESIRKRMMSDVPFGVFLSGGLDSSTNVALMAELSDQPVRTFSTAPREHSKYDELQYARLVADRFKTDHHEIVIDSDDMEEFLPTLFHHQDEPLSDWTAVPQHFVSKLARDTGTIVVQCGEGADELFHGYNGYVAHRRYVRPFQRLPRPVGRGVARLATRLTRQMGKGIRHGEALFDAAHSPLPYWGGALCFRGELKQEIVGDQPYPDSYTTVERIWREGQEALPGADIYQLMTYVELKQRLSELLLMRLDRMTMANSVEGREPFLDHELVAFALSLPPSQKYRDGVGKYVLREAVKDIVPREVIERPKQGFGTPVEEWLREDFGVRAQEEVRRSSLMERGLLDAERVDQLFEAHRVGRGNWSWHLWNIYSAAVWHDQWVAGRVLV
jgi:asparagine synthase (glutamine-hydrolysing)